MNEEFWKQFPPIPGFDCLEMKNAIQTKIYEEIKDMSPEEIVAYFNRAGNDFRCRGKIVPRSSEMAFVREEPAPYVATKAKSD